MIVLVAVRGPGTLPTVSWQGTGCAFSVRKEFAGATPIPYNCVQSSIDWTWSYRQLYLSIGPCRVSFRTMFCSKNDRGAGCIFFQRFARQIILLDAAGLAIITILAVHLAVATLLDLRRVNILDNSFVPCLSISPMEWYKIDNIGLCIIVHESNIRLIFSQWHRRALIMRQTIVLFVQMKF